MIALGLLIIAVGAFCQSSCYVPINKIRQWSWESYWFVQGIFAWLILPFLGALLAVPAGHSLLELYAGDVRATLLTLLFGVLWGVGGLTFGLSMRYLGVALGQSIALGTCAGLGTILTPVFTGKAGDLTLPVIVGVVVTLCGIAVIGIAGGMKTQTLSEEERKKAVKDFNFPLGIIVALLCGFMSACFSIGLGFGEHLNFGDATDPMFSTLPATLLVTVGGFLTNAVYCFYQNQRNKTWGDYVMTCKLQACDKKPRRGFPWITAAFKPWSLYLNNIVFCAIAGLLWYSQFFGLSLGKGFLTAAPVLLTFSWCILMALNVTFSNVWGIILREWKGVSQKTIAVLLLGLLILIVSIFLPYLL